MKALDKALWGHRCLVFLDLEGTQFTHEIIEIGAYKAYLKEDGTIKKVFKPFKQYVKPHARIGHVVTKLTGITEKQIAEEGVPFRVALQGFKKYVGKDWGKSLFVAYGNNDEVMFVSSSDNNLDASREDAMFVAKHMFDFGAFIYQFVKDDNGNAYSLTNCLKLFEYKFKGEAHDALADAYNLMGLYSAFLERRDIVEREYSKALKTNKKIPQPVRKVAEMLSNGETVTPDDLKREIHDFLA